MTEGEQEHGDSKKAWFVNAAGDVTDKDGVTATDAERHALMKRLEKKAKEKRASTVELRCLHALRQRLEVESERDRD